MLVLMVAGILVGGFTNTTNLTLLALRRQPHSLFERWSKLFGGWTPQRRASHPDAHPKRIERGASRLEANPSWRWIYGIMAAFGLRPHEAFFADLLQSNGHWSCHVTQGKTGDRTVLTAFPPDWVNLFDLPNKVLPNIEYQQAYAHGKLGERIAAQFRRYKVPFTAYSLRHAYAIRGALPPYNVSIVVMAAMMGHSPQVHLNTYQKHISSTQHQAAIDAALNQ